MENIIRKDIRDNGITNGELAKELAISEDRVTAMNNNSSNTALGRIIETYDYIGKVPVELIRDISNNTPALDSLEPSADDFLSTRAKIEKVIEEHGELSKDRHNAITNIIKAFESEYSYPLIYITGSECCGKASMAENLLGAQLKFASRIYERKYRHLVLMSDKRSCIEYNYPFGEYPYRIKESECITDLLKENFTDKTESCLEPVSAMDTQSLYSYAVYSAQPLLEAVNIVCSNALLLSPDAHDFEAVANTDAKIISMADIIVIMLDDTSAECLKLADIIQYALLRWGKDMKDHVIFTIAKSDRRSLEGEDGINERMGKYSKIIEAVLKNLELTKNNPETEQLLGHITDMIVPYSSIYKKNNDKDKADAMHNTDFYKKIHNMVFMALDDKKHRINLYDAVFHEQIRFFPQDINLLNIMPDDTAYALKYDIQKIFSEGRKSFENDFSEKYQGIISTDNIMMIIDCNNITRTDKNRLIAIINSMLTQMLINSTMSIYTQMVEKFTRLFDDIQDIEIKLKLLESVMHVSEKVLQRVRNENIKYKSIVQRDNVNQTDKKTSLGTSIGALAGGALVSLLPLTLPIVSGAATAGAVSYYAQTNFQKNTARKIVSLYNEHNIKKKFTDEVIDTYFVPLETELKKIVDSFTYKINEKTENFIQKIEEAIDAESLIQDKLDQLTQ